MHCVFSYDLAAERERRVEIETKILEILREYQHVKRLSTFFIVYIPSKEDWDRLLKELTQYLQPIPERAHFILSPPMVGGMYNGLLGVNDWAEINAITQK